MGSICHALAEPERNISKQNKTQKRGLVSQLVELYDTSITDNQRPEYHLKSFLS